ncbi:MAG: hypothetical protein Q9202_006340 [Teloschistes flavicans]
MGYHSLESLHTYFQDFAYGHQGRFRMANINIADTPAKTFAELLSGPTMDVYVGQSKRHWCLHQDLLCYHTPFFEDHIPEKGKQKHGKVELLEEDPRAFELLVKWLYQGRIDDVSDMPKDKKWDYADACQKLYILCDRVDMPQLKNIAIDQFRKGCFEAGLVPGPEEIKPIYDMTAPRSPIRKLISQIAARQIMDPESQSDAGTYRMCFEASADFAIDVVNAIRQGTGAKLFHDPTEDVGCVYHEHGVGHLCKVS